MSNDAGTHAFLNPSSAALTVACAYSATMRKLYPQPETDETREGTAAHWVALEAPDSVAVGGTVNGIPLTQDMIDGRDIVRAILPADLSRVRIEQRVGDPSSDNHGTPDWWWVDGDLLTVLDYKFGHGAVRAFENWQCIDYIRHILNDGVKFKRWKIIVVQPRCYTKAPVDTWEGKIGELTQYFVRITAAYMQARGVSAAAVPGAHCGDHYCPGRHACPALQKAAAVSVDTANAGRAEELTPAGVGTELKILTEAKAVLDARIDGLKECALNVINTGVTVPGWQMGRTRTRTVWGKTDAEVISMGAALGLSLSKPPAAVTPTQAVKAGLPETMLETFAKELPGSPVLQEVNLNDIQRRLKNG